MYMYSHRHAILPYLLLVSLYVPFHGGGAIASDEKGTLDAAGIMAGTPLSDTSAHPGKRRADPDEAAVAEPDGAGTTTVESSSSCIETSGTVRVESGATLTLEAATEVTLRPVIVIYKAEASLIPWLKFAELPDRSNGFEKTSDS